MLLHTIDSLARMEHQSARLGQRHGCPCTIVSIDAPVAKALAGVADLPADGH